MQVLRGAFPSLTLPQLEAVGFSLHPGLPTQQVLRPVHERFYHLRLPGGDGYDSTKRRRPLGYRKPPVGCFTGFMWWKSRHHNPIPMRLLKCYHHHTPALRQISRNAMPMFSQCRTIHPRAKATGLSRPNKGNFLFKCSRWSNPGRGAFSFLRPGGWMPLIEPTTAPRRANRDPAARCRGCRQVAGQASGAAPPYPLYWRRASLFSFRWVHAVKAPPTATSEAFCVVPPGASVVSKVVQDGRNIG